MQIIFHLSGGCRLDRRIEFAHGVVLQQSRAKGWYRLHVSQGFLDPSTAIDETAAIEALTRLYAGSGITLEHYQAQDMLYEVDVRQIPSTV